MVIVEFGFIFMSTSEAGYISSHMPHLHLVYSVNGSEIRHLPVDVVYGSLSHYLQGFINIPSGCLGFLNHQQYECIS